MNNLFLVLQVLGIGPRLSGWKPNALPLRHTCLSISFKLDMLSHKNYYKKHNMGTIYLFTMLRLNTVRKKNIFSL